MNRVHSILFIILLGLLANLSEAHLFVTPHIQDHMILQRNKQNKIWGPSGKDECITLGVDRKIQSRKAAKDGKENALLSSFPAGGSYLVQISKNSDKLKIIGVLIEDLWLCIGQSNMELAVGSFSMASKEMDKDDYSNIGFMNVPIQTRQAVLNDTHKSLSWGKVTVENIKMLSEVFYRFDQNLQPKLGIPIGVVAYDWIHDAIDPWTSNESLNPYPKSKDVIDFPTDEIKPSAQMEKALKEYPKNDWAPNYFFKRMDMNNKWGEPITDYSTLNTIKWSNWGEDFGVPDLKNHKSLVWFRATFYSSENFKDSASLIVLNPIDNYSSAWQNGIKFAETYGDSQISTNKYGHLIGLESVAKGRDFHWETVFLCENKITVCCEQIKDLVDVSYGCAKSKNELNIYGNNNITIRSFLTNDRLGVIEGRVYDIHKVSFKII